MDSSKKSLLKHTAVALILLTISVIYFYPAFQGYQLETHDINMYKGGSHSIAEHRDTYGEEPLWSNSMFGGMPADQLSVRHESNLVSYIYKVYTLFLPRPISMLWTLFIGFYIFTLFLKMDPWLGLIGALMFGFSTFFMVSMQAGHMSKVNAIAFIAPMIGALIYTFRTNYLIGSISFSLFAALQIWCNHFQITYYAFLIIALIAIFLVVEYIRKGRSKELLKVVGVTGIAFLLALSTSTSNLWGTYSYSKETMRGKSEMTLFDEGTDAGKDGLDSDYILAWSYGKGEIFSLVIPSIKGGGNNDQELKNYEELYPKATENALENYQEKLAETQLDEIILNYTQGQLPIRNMIAMERGYYGPQGLTNGPAFIGIIAFFLALLSLVFSDGKFNLVLLIALVLNVICAYNGIFYLVVVAMLAFLALVIVNGKLVWYLAFTVLLTVLLSWGKYFLDFSQFFIDYFPMYSKFRSVTFILVIAEVLVPIMAVMFLYKLFTKPDFIESNKTKFFITGGVSAAFFLLLLVNPAILFDISASKSDYLPYVKSTFDQIAQSVPEVKQYAGELINFESIYKGSLIELRTDIIRNDIVLLLFFMIGTGAIIILFYSKKINKNLAAGLLSLLILLEMVPVSLNYLNSEKDEAGDFKYWEAREESEIPFKLLPGDVAILNQELSKRPELLPAINQEIAKENANRDFPLDTVGQKLVAFKVLNQNSNFRVANFQGLTSETRTSYFYKSLGGYHGAKLQRTQDLFDGLMRGKIDAQTILNLMNVKYIVNYENDRNGEIAAVNPAPNPEAYGHAWIVDDVRTVDDANAEMKMMFKEAGVDFKTTAVINNSFIERVGAYESKSADAEIELNSHKANELTYKFSSSKNQLVVFSEIFYDYGWQAYIDGNEVEHFRANYLLRGLTVPAGNHEITFKYLTPAFKTGSMISLLGSILLIALILGVILVYFKKPNLLEQAEINVLDDETIQ